EWTDAAHRWCERQAISGFPGVCRVHRAEIVALQGALDRAEQELQQATQELAAYNVTPPLADGFYALGEIRLRLGDMEGAEDALRQAHSLGRAPQPALALIRLSEGKVRAAFRAISSALAEQTWDRWARARMLPAQVEIAVAAGELETAREAAKELSMITESYGSPALHATKHSARGRVLLAEGKSDEAIREIRTGLRYWQEVGAPYEVARDRMVLATALHEVGHDDEADLEFEAARAEFERLGAVRDEASAAAAIRAASERNAAAVTTRKTFVFTDIVSSTNLVEAMGDEAWEHILRWHNEALRSLFVRHGGEVVQETGDGFFAAFDSSVRAIECAVSVQRSLAEHRRTHGFAPAVRIGVHAADAHRRGGNYRGKGVHVAARIAALADGGQVLASAETAAEAGTSYAMSEPRAVALKGVSAEVGVVSVAWD
ncbi:MAG TPA: adenylate/guanylate cyclase domain-containing protein, partial [Actinomycetota bacterium]|nr:adenylate/guanylate cyclase domain-containing protein [Actinomycetota bacterium]